MNIQPVGYNSYSRSFGSFAEKNGNLKKDEENKSAEPKKVLKIAAKGAILGAAVAAVGLGLNFLYKIKTGKLILVRTVNNAGRVVGLSFAKLVK